MTDSQSAKDASVEETREPALLDVRDLTLDIPTAAGTARVLRGVDLVVSRGSTLGIVGESGSGKSMLLRTVLGLTPSNAIINGRITFDNHDLRTMPAKQRRGFLGKRVGVVFQNPMTSLNPVVRIARQMEEASRRHLGLTRSQSRARAIDLLGQVGMPNASRRIDDYPHEFSGGMRQRVMIAMALMCEPELLVADEATTALDVTIQKGILDLLQRLQAERQMTLVLVSHDLSVVSGRTDRVVVMNAGNIVEQAPTSELFSNYRHRYTEALLRAIPRLDLPAHTELKSIPGRPPSVLQPISGCPFAPRCDFAVAECNLEYPQTVTEADGAHSYNCYMPVTFAHVGVRNGRDNSCD